MNRLTLSAMSFAGLGMLLIAGAGVAGAGRMQDDDAAYARRADGLPGVESSGSNHVTRRTDGDVAR